MDITERNRQRIQQMQTLLQDAFKPSSLEIIDDSQRHKGHAGAKNGAGHFIVKIASLNFQGKKPLERHRLIYQALGHLMETEIHALKMEAKVE